MSAQWRVFLAAVQYFTRLPVPASVGHSQQLLDDAARYFPAVGTLVGVASAATFFVGSLLLPPTVAALLAVGVAVWITGAFHEDGLADAIDGIGGGYERQRILEIMRDSRIGTYGAVAFSAASC
jgi:adenosylcobinamide-GDP ribazoletransferase